MTEKLTFTVIGDNDQSYEFVIQRDPLNTANLSASCNCEEAAKGKFCDSCFRIFEGDHSYVASENLGDLETLNHWVRGSDIEVAMIELSKAKTDLALARERLAYCRTRLVKRMLD